MQKKRAHPGDNAKEKRGEEKNCFPVLPFGSILPARPIRRARGFWNRRFLMIIRRGSLRSVIATTQSQLMRLTKKVAAMWGLIFHSLIDDDWPRMALTDQPDEGRGSSVAHSAASSCPRAPAAAWARDIGSTFGARGKVKRAGRPEKTMSSETSL